MKLGSYDLLEKIGKGGMGTVYQGIHRETGAVVAVKVMKIDNNLQSVIFRRFEKEFQIAQRLDHPNIVRVLDFGWESGRAFLVMEFVEGQNLAQLLRKRERLPETEALTLTLQVAEALASAHKHNLVHRDVKPENIMVTRDGVAKLTDFGLIKDLDGRENLTKTRTCLGTLAYMAPEQYEDAKNVDVRCDVYSLAATVYFALTGENPFPGNGNLTILAKKLKNDFAAPSKLLPGLNPKLDSLICRSLDADPNRRPLSCQELIKARRQILAAPAPAGKSKAAEPDTVPDLSDAERRIARRFQVDREGICRVGQERKHSWSGTLQDVSQTGAKLKLSRRFEVGTLVALEVQDRDANPVATLWMRVCWLKPDTDNNWLLGCAFQMSLEEEELDDLLDGNTTHLLVAE